MDKEMIIDRLKKVITDLMDIAMPDHDANLFNVDINISPVKMVYLLLELEHEFHITIDDRFMDELPSITINHLADAICICSE